MASSSPEPGCRAVIKHGPGLSNTTRLPAILQIDGVVDSNEIVRPEDPFAVMATGALPSIWSGIDGNRMLWVEAVASCAANASPAIVAKRTNSFMECAKYYLKPDRSILIGGTPRLSYEISASPVRRNAAQQTNNRGPECMKKL